MIAVLDTTRGGWGFVSKLHRSGFAISWVVGRDVDIGFDALPTAFRGVVHRVGFDDLTSVLTAVRGCSEVILLTDEGSLENSEVAALERSVSAQLNREIPLYLVIRKGGIFEVRELDMAGTAPGPTKATPTPMLVRHVG